MHARTLSLPVLVGAIPLKTVSLMNCGIRETFTKNTFKSRFDFLNNTCRLWYFVSCIFIKIEEKKKLEAEKKERERIEEEKEERRIEEQRKRIQAELEAEQEKERKKQEAARQKHEDLRIQAEQKKKEDQQKRLKEEEELRQQKEEELNEKLRRAVYFTYLYYHIEVCLVLAF